MDDREIPSEGEYFAGRTDDGRKPMHHSRKLTDDPTKPFSEEPAEFPFENRDPRTLSADELRYHVKRQELDDADLVLNTARELIALGMAAGRRAVGTVPEVRDCPRPSAEPQAPDVDASTATDAAPVGNTGTVLKSGDSPLFGGSPDLRARVNVPHVRVVNEQSKVVVPEPAVKPDTPPPEVDRRAETIKRVTRPARSFHFDPDIVASIKPEAGLVLAERGCRLLAANSAMRANIARELIEMAMVLETKHSFMWDRATAVVYATLLHLDETLSDVGFGAWMPFRWPDQWLSFCGVLTRVLAANGLLHGKYADVYRKLLDETPPVEFEGTVQDRIKETRTPNNIAQCKWNQGAYTMSELKTRLEKEVWEPDDEFEELWAKYWEDQLIKPPVPRRDGTVKPPYVPPKPPWEQKPPG